MELKQLSLFLIMYDPADKLSHLFAWTSLFPIFIVVGHAGVLLVRREMFSAYFFSSYLVGEVFNSLLKSYIKEHRPEASFKPGYGMPSDHAQFMASAFVLTVLLLYVRLSWQHSFWKHLTAASAFVVSILVAAGRVYSGVHTPAQVAAGYLIGLVFGTVWFFVGHQVIAPLLFPWIVRLQLARYLLIRDSTHTPNILYREYLISQDTTKSE